MQEISGRHRLGPGPKGDDYNPDVLQMYWCNDTPGVVNPQQVSVLALSALSRSVPWHCQPSAGQCLALSTLSRWVSARALSTLSRLVPGHCQPSAR